MKKTMFTLIAAILISCASALSAQAQLARTFVSTTGNDANTCDRDAPCRNFNEAISKTAAGGVVTALDSGSYGHITVRKSLTIQGAPGAAVVVSRTSPKQPVVFVELEPPLSVVLRNLQISKPSHVDGPNKGIDFRSAGSLHVENCIISGFDFEATDAGISVSYFGTTESAAKLLLTDTLIRDNIVGIRLLGRVEASIENCRIQNNGITGISVKNTRTTISKSLVAGNSSGVEINDGGLAYLETCTVTNNDLGIHVRTGGYVYVSNTGIVANDFGVLSDGFSYSFSNNRLANNMNGSFNHTISQQ